MIGACKVPKIDVPLLKVVAAKTEILHSCGGREVDEESASML